MKKKLFHFQNPILKILILVLLVGCFSLTKVLILKAGERSRLDLVLDTEPEPTPDSPSPDLPSPDTPTETWKYAADLMLWAINPGYTVDGSRDVGEFIELHRTTDSPISLAGYSLRYINSSGASSTLADFIEGSTLAGETLLLRLARSSAPGQSDLTYMTTLAMSNGRIELLHDGEIIDSVCWSNKDDCLPNFKSAKPTSLVRNLETGQFIHISDYEPSFSPDSPSLILPEIPDDPSDEPEISEKTPTLTPSERCGRLEFSEILSYYDEDKSEQFIELHNPTDQTINLSACEIRYKKKNHTLSGSLAPDQYYAYYPNKSDPAFSVTKNPNTSNTIDLIGKDETLVDTLSYNHGQKKATSYARFYDENGEEFWQTTYSPTPGSANILQEFRSCPEGKIINIATGNCVKVTGASGTTKACPEGQYRNPLTGRCKKVESDSKGPKPCAKGYERNPETNRCRKIKKTNEGTEYPLVPKTYANKSTFIAAGIIILLVLVGVGYIILQFRHEIVRVGRKTRQRIHNVCKNVITGSGRFHRNKKP